MLQRTLFLLVLTLKSVMAAQNAFKFKFSTELLTHMIHLNDQEILHSLQDLIISYKKPMVTAQRGIVMKGPDDRCTEVNFVKFSILPNENIAFEDYDLDISLNDKEKGYLGFEAKDLRLVGYMTLNETDTWDFTAPIDQFLLEVDMVPETNPEILALNWKAVMPQVKEFKFEPGQI